MKTQVNSSIYFTVVILGFLFGNILISFGSIENNEYCQTIDVKELIIRDTNMYSLLQRIIYNEQSNNIHFTDSTVFGVWIEESRKNEASLITITGTDNLSILLQVSNVKGFFKYRGHYFILMTACTKLFRESAQYQTFDIDSTVEIYDDDRWPFHYIKYYQGAFYLIEN